MSVKITGYMLLFLGIGIMIFCAVNIFMVFTNKIKPFLYFNISSANNAQSSLDVGNIVRQMQNDNKGRLNESIPLPKFDLVPPEVLNQTLNLSAQFFLMTFILGFGYKLANLGVQLIRPINVKLKTDPTSPS